MFLSFLIQKQIISMPMKSIITQAITQQQKNKKGSKAEVNLQPSERTVTILKLFARNYQVEPSMPEGLQGFILG